MRHTAAEHVRLRQAVERTGYYPELVLDSLRTALGAQDIASFLVHHEATFDGVGLADDESAIHAAKDTSLTGRRRIGEPRHLRLDRTAHHGRHRNRLAPRQIDAPNTGATTTAIAAINPCLRRRPRSSGRDRAR